VEDDGGGSLWVKVGVGEEFGGGEALGHGVFGVVGHLVERFDGVVHVAVRTDLRLEIGQFLAQFELVLANVRVEEIGELFVGALEVFAELVGVRVAVDDGVERCGREFVNWVK